MIKKSLVISTFFTYIFCISFVLGTENAKYITVIDAGSSSSKLHLFEVMEDASSYTKANEISIDKDFAKVKPGISDMLEKLTQDELNEYFKPMLEGLKTTIGTETELKDIDFYFLATGGMRNLSESDQTKIYDEVRKWWKATNINIKNIETLSGEIEGAFAWIAVNDILETKFKNESKGIFEMGGQSVQIAFYYPDAKADIKFNLGQDNISLYSKSYLGIGNDALRQYFAHSGNSAGCFQNGYVVTCPFSEKSITGTADYNLLLDKSQNLLEKYQVEKLPKEHLNLSNFYGIGSFSYLTNSNVFKDELGEHPSPKNIKEVISIFGNKPYLEEIEKYQDDYLYTYYPASGVIYTLLVDFWGFNQDDSYTAPLNMKIEGASIDWPLGAAIFIVNDNKISQLEELPKAA